LVSDNILVTKLSLREAARGYLISLKASRYSPRYIRSGGAERYLRIAGGWRRIPETYFRTLGTEDVARAHRQLSPGDRLAEQLRGRGRIRVKQARQAISRTVNLLIPNAEPMMISLAVPVHPGVVNYREN